MRYVLIACFLFSLFALPWWVTVPLGILLATTPLGSAIALLGGAILDATHGAPITPLFGISYLYTLTFMLSGLAILLIQRRVMD